MKKNKSLFLFLLVTFTFILSCNKKDDDMSIPTDNTMEEPLDSIIPPAITLTISNINEIEGQLWIALYDNEEDWDADIKDEELTENEYILLQVIVQESSHSIHFTELPTGSYAISMFHDLDSSGELEKGGLFNLFPQEPYGFSNNFTPTFGAPDFSDCSFNVGENQIVELSIELIDP